MAQSGQVVVTTAGTEVRMTTQKGRCFIVKAMPANTGIMYVGNNGDDTVTALTGYPLSVGDAPLILENGGEYFDLNQFWVDASVNGEKVAWLMVS